MAKCKRQNEKKWQNAKDKMKNKKYKNKIQDTVQKIKMHTKKEKNQK